MKSGSHASAGKRKSIDANLLGPCGFFCGFCLAYKKGICLGCRYQADKRARDGNLKWCTQLNCAEKHGVSMCSDCEKFPCTEFDPKVGMFSEVYMKYIRDKVKPA
ncbi:MAG: DUF3795 domain-containing protein [Thermoplasmatota archaeon]|nr:DUF3795 domain-containing protein [Candidatus Thermoplasmatota archaeon]MBU1914036.1 DUF3795 domain-containing protein [Candidatus Thermoplasmatota archaeon]